MKSVEKTAIANKCTGGRNHLSGRIYPLKFGYIFLHKNPLNQRYDIIICVYLFVLFSQVSDVAHGPLVYVNK